MLQAAARPRSIAEMALAALSPHKEAAAWPALPTTYAQCHVVLTQNAAVCARIRAAVDTPAQVHACSGASPLRNMNILRRALTALSNPEDFFL